jgi:eukaryotic-like serine/threonine-protein kinase
VSGANVSGDDATAVVGTSGVSGRERAPDGWAERATIGGSLGRYLVIEELGRGGMGVVLRAYDPKLQREVALKLVHTGALDASAQARLIREARAMARLSHPNVVAVYDVELDDGVVLVMEYVPGTTLGQWLQQTPRSPNEVVEAFLSAGRGLAAAHHEGLLHRDFKLDNVLVGTDRRVRVTDFGLARAEGPRVSADAVHAGTGHGLRTSDDARASGADLSLDLTDAGIVMGTPRYMPPEQAEGREIDARADQYAFCVALWRALTGRWPFEGRGRSLQRAKYDGAPPWPRDVPVPRNVVEAVRRGLAPDPALRWSSIPALLTELSRNPSRRRRRLLAAGALTLAVVGAWGTQRLQRARTLASCASEGARIDEVWNAARAGAIEKAFETTGVSYARDTWTRSRVRIDDFAQEWTHTRRSTCERADVEQTLGRDVAERSRACLDEHADTLEALLQQLEQPDATVIEAVGTAVASLPLVRACTDENLLRHREKPPSDADMRERVRALQSRLSMAFAAQTTGRHALALEHGQAVLDEALALPWAPLATEAKFAVAEALGLRASTAMVFTLGERLAQPEDGMHWARLSRMLIDRLTLSDDLAVAELLHNVASIHVSMGEFEKAHALHEEARAIREKALGPEHPGVASSLNHLATGRYAVGAHEDAKRLLERAVEIRQRALGPEHPSIASNLTNLATVNQTMGALEEARVLHERALAIQETNLGPEHPEVAAFLNNFASLRAAMGAHDEARAMHERALAIREKALGPEHPSVAVSLNNLANVYMKANELEEARALQLRAQPILEKALGPEHPSFATSLYNLGNVHRLSGELEEARQYYERAVTIWENALGPEHPDVAMSLHELAQVHATTGAYGEAKAAYQRALAIWEKVPDPERADKAAAGLAELEAR